MCEKWPTIKYIHIPNSPQKSAAYHHLGEKWGGGAHVVLPRWQCSRKVPAHVVWLCSQSSVGLRYWLEHLQGPQRGEGIKALYPISGDLLITEHTRSKTMILTMTSRELSDGTTC